MLTSCTGLLVDLEFVLRCVFFEWPRPIPPSCFPFFSSFFPLSCFLTTSWQAKREPLIHLYQNVHRAERSLSGLPWNLSCVGARLYMCAAVLHVDLMFEF